VSLTQSRGRRRCWTLRDSSSSSGGGGGGGGGIETGNEQVRRWGGGLRQGRAVTKMTRVDETAGGVGRAGALAPIPTWLTRGAASSIRLSPQTFAS